MVSRPSKNFDIVQGTVAGSEFEKLKKDSAPLEEPEAQKISPAKPKKKKTRKIVQTRRIKKKKYIKKLKPVPVDEEVQEQPIQGHPM